MIFIIVPLTPLANLTQILQMMFMPIAMNSVLCAD
jgi:hypothetical protein